MTWVAREIPRGSGHWRAVNEPGQPKPREAPQFECSLCSRVIAKKRSVFLLRTGRVTCLGCADRHDLYGGGHIATRAAAAARLGIWPGRPPAAKVSFRQWIKRFTADQCALGELARDVHADRRWPRGPGSLARYEAYLASAGADPAVTAALRRAWARYERDRRAGRR